MKSEQERIEELKAISMGTSEEFDKLLEAPYCIIDILPKQVYEDRDGQFFAIEKYFSTEPQRSVIRQKFANFILKLNCYADIFINGEMNPAPESIVEKIRNHQVSIVLDYFLITSDSDESYITVYNANEEMMELLRKIANSEGLCLWQEEQE